MDKRIKTDLWRELCGVDTRPLWVRLPVSARVAIGAGAVLLVVGGGLAGAATIFTNSTRHPPFAAAGGDTPTAGPTAGLTPGQPVPAQSVMKDRNRSKILPQTVAAAHRSAISNHHQATPLADRPTSPRATPPPVAAVHPGAEAPGTPVITTRTETETQNIPFETRLIYDWSLPPGTRQTRSSGETGQKTLHYLVTLTNGHQTGRHLLDSIETRPPKQEVIALSDQIRDQGDDQRLGAGNSGDENTWHQQPGSDSIWLDRKGKDPLAICRTCQEDIHAGRSRASLRN